MKINRKNIRKVLADKLGTKSGKIDLACKEQVDFLSLNYLADSIMLLFFNCSIAPKSDFRTDTLKKVMDNKILQSDSNIFITKNKLNCLPKFLDSLIYAYCMTNDVPYIPFPYDTTSARIFFSCNNHLEKKDIQYQNDILYKNNFTF